MTQSANASNSPGKSLQDIGVHPELFGERGALAVGADGLIELSDFGVVAEIRVERLVGRHHPSAIGFVVRQLIEPVEGVVLVDRDDTVGYVLTDQVPQQIVPVAGDFGSAQVHAQPPWTVTVCRRPSVS